MACCLVSRSLKKVIYCPQVGSTSTKWSPNSKLSQSFPKTVSKNIKSFSKGYPKLSKSFPKGGSTYLNISQCLEVVPKLFYTAKLSLYLVSPGAVGLQCECQTVFRNLGRLITRRKNKGVVPTTRRRQFHSHNIFLILGDLIFPLHNVHRQALNL